MCVCVHVTWLADTVRAIDCLHLLPLLLIDIDDFQRCGACVCVHVTWLVDTVRAIDYVNLLLVLLINID